MQKCHHYWPLPCVQQDRRVLHHARAPGCQHSTHHTCGAVPAEHASSGYEWLKFPRAACLKQRADHLLERAGPGGCPANGADGGDVKDLSFGIHGGHEHGLAQRRWSELVAGKVGCSLTAAMSYEPRRDVIQRVKQDMRDGGWSGDVKRPRERTDKLLGPSREGPMLA
ncbi:hypothetical protein BC567DRAFT_250459 [Phyllosticta citribraziliensis]